MLVFKFIFTFSMKTIREIAIQKIAEKIDLNHFELFYNKYALKNVNFNKLHGLLKHEKKSKNNGIFYQRICY